VLGTAFNIRAYPDESDVTVTVTRGKVKVETEQQILGILYRNQQISYNKKSSAAIQHKVVADSVLTWKEKDLVFDNVTFAEAATVICERYGVDIVFVNEKMKKCRFHASFLNEKKVEQILTVLCELNKATYQIQNNVVTVSGEGCN
jgi:ferric-dicitrate binding protein FerR (iron transport regulator)